MRYALLALARNVASGLRLAFFLPVDRLRFRADPLQFLLLVLVSAAIDFVADWYRYGPDAVVSFAAIGSELAPTGLLVVTAALLAWAWGRRDLLLAIPVIVLASFAPLQVASGLVDVVPFGSEPSWFADDLPHLVVLAWVFAVLLRSAWVGVGPGRGRGRRALVAGLLLALPLLLPAGILPSDPWWEAGNGGSGAGASPASEPVLALQREMQDEALSNLEDHTPGSTDLYFVGFAPDGDGDTWRARMNSAAKVLEGHWGSEGRTVVYVNDPSLVTQVPLATVTHLREALSEIAATADPDEDVVMLYLGGRSNPDGSMTVSAPPLDLVQLTGPGLRSLLDEAGFAWRVVVVAACAPGPFIDALADDRTMVIASASAGGVAPDCTRQREPTTFGDAFFNEALPRASSLPSAFEAAKRIVTDTGSASGPSAPVMHVGKAIAEKLESVRSKAGGGVMASRKTSGVRAGLGPDVHSPRPGSAGS